MRRRAFVAALATAPWWIRRAFGDASLGAATTTPALPVTWPTLVLVIPRDPAARADRGRAFGELLGDGSDRDLAPLGALALVCAPASDFGVAGDPLLLYVDGARVQPLDAPLPRHDLRRDDDDATQARARIAILARLVRSAIPMGGELDERAAAAAVRRRYGTTAPRGARWGRFTGCGVAYAGEPFVARPCGMGHVPKIGARFLDFYTRKART